jgi:hypothetical protein
VERDSPPLTNAGPTVAINTTLDSPLSVAYSRRVSLLSRNGMCDLLPLAMADMTLPKALREALILFASSSLTPVEVVFLTRSDPAKSINVNLELIRFPSKL